MVILVVIPGARDKVVETSTYYKIAPRLEAHPICLHADRIYSKALKTPFSFCFFGHTFAFLRPQRITQLHSVRSRVCVSAQKILVCEKSAATLINLLPLFLRKIQDLEVPSEDKTTNQEKKIYIKGHTNNNESFFHHIFFPANTGTVGTG